MMRRTAKIVGIALAAALLVAAIAGLLYVNSASFQGRVRQMVVSELELLTGGRVEIGSLAWSLTRVQFEIHDVTVHGLEGPGEPPYIHTDRLFVRAKIVSLFSREVSLRNVEIERPVVCISVRPGGTTTQPVPKIRQVTGVPPVDRLLDLAITHLSIDGGRLLLNDQEYQFDLDAGDVALATTYALLAHRYDGEMRAGSIQIKRPAISPVVSALEFKFSLWPTRAEIKSLKWTSAHSRIEAGGTVEDFRDPKVDFAYKAWLDAAEFGRIAHSPELRSGVMELDGQAAYLKGAYSSAGKMRLKDVLWEGALLRVSGLNAGAQFTVNRQRIVLSNLFGSVFGGAVTGAAELRNWTPAPRKTSEAKGNASLRFQRLQLPYLLPAFPGSSARIHGVNPVGTASGSLRAQWTGPAANAQVAVEAEVVPPPNPAAGQLPVTARLQAVYDPVRQTIEVPRLDLATRSTHIEATGVLGSTSAKLRLSVNTADIGEWQPVLALMHEGTIPADVQGRALFYGAVSGKLKELVIAGHVEANDFDTWLKTPPAMVPAGAPPGRLRMRWDLLRADVTYSASQALVQRGTLRRGAAEIDFDASAQLHNGSFENDSPFTLRGTFANAEVADIQALLESDYPVTGKASGRANLSGTLNDLRGDGQVQTVSLRIVQEPFNSLSANLRFADHEAQFNDLVVSHNGARITGAVAYLTATKGIRFDLRGDSFDLAKVQRLQTERFKVSGRAQFQVSGSGTLDSPVLNGKLGVKDLVVNGETVGDISADAVTRGADLQLSGRAHFQSSELTIEGGAHLRDQWPVNLRLHFTDFSIDPVLRAYLQGRVTGHSSMEGFVYVKGPLRRPRDLNVTGTIDSLSAEVEKMRIRADEPIRFALASQVFSLQHLHLVAEGTDFTGSGSMQLGGARELNARADGHLNMRMLQTFNPDLTSSGRMDMAVSVGGVLDRPELSGQLRIQDAGLSFIDVPNGLSHINGTLIFNENRLRVQSLTAQTGGGELQIAGFISYSRGLQFNLTARSTDIRLRYAGVSAIASADLRYAGSLPNSRLSGDVVIQRFALNTRFDFAQYLAQAKQEQTAAAPDSPMSNLHLDVHITSSPELQMQTSSAHVSATVDLRLRGTATHPVLLGRVNVLDGQIAINGTKYHIERGDITFSNPTRIEPILDLEATARIRDYDISLGIHGIPPDNLRSTYRSDPPLPPSDVIALLALGRTKEESVLSIAPTQNYTESASSAILGEALNQAVSNRSQKIFGLSRIKIDPEAGGPESNPNARATIEQQVSDKVTLTFITNLSQSAQQIIQVEYQVNRDLTIIGIRDQNGVLAFDVRYRRRKR